MDGIECVNVLAVDERDEGVKLMRGFQCVVETFKCDGGEEFMVRDWLD